MAFPTKQLLRKHYPVIGKMNDKTYFLEFSYYTIMPTWRELFSQNRNNEIEDRCLYLIFILKLQLCIIIYIKYITSDIYFCKYSFDISTIQILSPNKPLINWLDKLETKLVILFWREMDKRYCWHIFQSLPQKSTTLRIMTQHLRMKVLQAKKRKVVRVPHPIITNQFVSGGNIVIPVA